MKKNHIINTLALYVSFVACNNYSNSTFGMKGGFKERNAEVCEENKNEVRSRSSTKILEKCCSCFIDNDDNINNSILVEEQAIRPKINFEDCSFSNIASLMVRNSSRCYFVRSSDNDGLFIKFKTSLVENPDQLGEVSILNNVVEGFLVVLNKMFNDKKFIFGVKHYLYDIQSENYSIVKFELDNVLVKYLEVEKKFWKKTCDNVFEEIDLYSDIPVITRLPLGICPMNPKKLMSDTHFLLFMPAVVDGSFITVDRLYSLVHGALKRLKIKKENFEECKEMANDNVFPAEITLESLDSKRNSDSFASVGSSSYEVNNSTPLKKKTNKSKLTLSPGIDEENIRFMANEYLLRNANNWVLVNIELKNLDSVPNNYRSPNLVEAICIMLYAIENNLKLILKEGIAINRQGEKVDSVYFVEYLKNVNSINICLRPRDSIYQSLVLRGWYKGDDVVKDNHQSAFVYPDYLCQICMCPAYCCHGNILLQNPFCSSNCGINGFWEKCLVCPAIDDCCIYPTSESFCKRCEDISCKKDCGCITFNSLAYSCFLGVFCGVSCGFIF